jgi:hypothetical protein
VDISQKNLVFLSNELLAPRPKPKLADHPFSAIRELLLLLLLLLLCSLVTGFLSSLVLFLLSQW